MSHRLPSQLFEMSPMQFTDAPVHPDDVFGFGTVHKRLPLGFLPPTICPIFPLVETRIKERLTLEPVGASALCQLIERGPPSCTELPLAGLVTFRVAGFDVARLNWSGERGERDDWSVFVARPRPEILVLATTEAVLSETLDRFKHGGVARALPKNAPRRKQSTFTATSSFGPEATRRGARGTTAKGHAKPDRHIPRTADPLNSCR